MSDDLTIEDVQSIAQDIVQKTIADNASKSQMGVSDIPYHVHDGLDTSQISATDLTDLVTAWSRQIYVADTAASDSYVVAMLPAPNQYFVGLQINFKATTANTGAATLNVNGLGAIAIKKLKSVTLADNDIVAGQIVTVIYDGTNFQMQSQIATAVAAPAIPLSTGTTKGDLVGYSASSTVGRIGVGADNTVLTADSSQTLGVKWGTPSTITPYVFGNMTAVVLNPGNGTTNTDYTVTTTFTPTLIKLTFFLQGWINSLAVYSGVKATAVFNGTTLVGVCTIWGLDDGAGSALSGDNGTLNTANNGQFDNIVNSGTMPLVGDTGVNSVQTTITISSVSSTNFVIRVTTVAGNGNTHNSRARCAYEAWA